jgi:fumarate hydratase class II
LSGCRGCESLADQRTVHGAAQISLKAYREDLTLRDAALALGFLMAEQFDEWVRPQDMTHPLGT